MKTEKVILCIAVLSVSSMLSGCTSMIASAVSWEYKREKYDPRTYEYSVAAILTVEHAGQKFTSQSHYDIYSHHKCIAFNSETPANTCFEMIGPMLIALSDSEFMIVTPRFPKKLFATSDNGEIALATTYSIEKDVGKESRCNWSVNDQLEGFHLTLRRLSNSGRYPPIDLRALYPAFTGDQPDFTNCVALLQLAKSQTIKPVN